MVLDDVSISGTADPLGFTENGAKNKTKHPVAGFLPQKRCFKNLTKPSCDWSVFPLSVVVQFTLGFLILQ